MKKKVLFVDDEENVLDGLRRILRHQRKEWDLFFARNVAEALDLLASESFDTVVSDIDMPGRSGFDLLQTIRGVDAMQDIPVVILTGGGKDGLKRKALDLGATDLINKPVNRDDLVARISSVLRIKAYQDEIKAHNEQLEHKVRERTAELERAQLELIWRLGKAGEFRDSDTGNHVIRVGYYSHFLAGHLGLDTEYCRRLFLTSPLHDIGKIGIPDGILLKPGKLTPEEWETMREHTSIGARILRDDVFLPAHLALPEPLILPADEASCSNPFIEMAAEIAESHHERWDGQGYPRGLSREEIPLPARITAFADVFDALSSKRPYKGALAEPEVLELVRRGVGTQFDPAIHEAFERALEQFRDILSDFTDEEGEHVQADVLASLNGLARAS